MNKDTEPMVRNAADESQVKKADEKNKLRRLNELEDMKSVLKTVEGRRVFWRLLQHCKVFETVFEQSSKIYYNSGKQDLGHHIMSEIVQANEDAFLLMMKENKEK